MFVCLFVSFCFSFSIWDFLTHYTVHTFVFARVKEAYFSGTSKYSCRHLRLDLFYIMCQFQMNWNATTGYVFYALSYSHCLYRKDTVLNGNV